MRERQKPRGETRAPFRARGVEALGREREREKKKAEKEGKEE